MCTALLFILSSFSHREVRTYVCKVIWVKETLSSSQQASSMMLITTLSSVSPLLPLFPPSEHRQRLPVVHRSRVQAQPDPGTKEDAVPSLLAQPGCPTHFPSHPATDVPSQVRSLKHLNCFFVSSPSSDWLHWKQACSPHITEEKKNKLDLENFKSRAFILKEPHSVISLCLPLTRSVSERQQRESETL